MQPKVIQNQKSFALLQLYTISTHTNVLVFKKKTNYEQLFYDRFEIGVD